MLDIYYYTKPDHVGYINNPGCYKVDGWGGEISSSHWSEQLYKYSSFGVRGVSFNDKRCFLQ